ncbi:hypothetical protein K4T06_02205 [Staphylococcus epidermidis]|nr:hypothetical protein [Staphylococcus epidermidis]MCG2347152.1 hypothetical protein [Staphylococcus epidermidis]
MNAETKFVSSVMDARLKKVKRERDAYKKQRDELINDMAEVKRKAEAFDEMVKIYNQKNDLPSDEIFMIMGYCISDLERGSDEKI